MNEIVQGTARLMPPKRMTLASISKGAGPKPPRILIYGVDAVGKTTFAANMPSPVFVGVEDGLAAFDEIPRYPQPRSWSEVLDALDALIGGEHSFRTLALDTLDWLEPLCWQHVIRAAAGRRNKQGRLIESIEDFDWGAGYTAALDEWRILVERLDRLRNERGMMIALVAHAWIRTFKNPDGPDFDRYEIKLNSKAGGLLREWADLVLFAAYEQYTHKDDKRVKGITTGARVVYTQRRAAWDAKSRYPLPEMLPLDWPELQTAIAAQQSATPETFKTRIAELLEACTDDALKERVTKSVAIVGDNTGELSRIANKLAAQITIKQHTETT